MLLKKTVLVTTTLAVAATSAVLSSGAAHADPATAGTYNAVAPTRVLDTRIGTGGPRAKVAAHGSITFGTAAATDATSVEAEALTVTVVNPTVKGYLAVVPGAQPLPATSNLNFMPGRTTANSVIVPGGAAGTVTVYNESAAPVDVAADLSGYWTGGTVDDSTVGAYTTVSPARLLDTRTGNKPVAANGVVSVPVLGAHGIPDSGVSAVAVNIAVPIPAAGGYVTATAASTDQEGSAPTSDVNLAPGTTASNLVIVPVDPSTGAISLHVVSTASANVVVDVQGYFTDGVDGPSADGSFAAFTPYRNSDTRSGSPVAAGKTAIIDFGFGGGAPLFKSAVVNITEVGATKPGHFSVSGGTTSTLNFAAGQLAADTAIVPINDDGTISVQNDSAGTANVIVDVHGFILNAVSDGQQAKAQRQVKAAIARSRKAASQRLAR